MDKKNKFYIVKGVHANGSSEILYSGLELKKALDWLNSNGQYAHLDGPAFIGLELHSAEVGDLKLCEVRDVKPIKQYTHCEYCDKRIYKDKDTPKNILITHGDDRPDRWATVCEDCAKQMSLKIEDAVNGVQWTLEY